MTRSELQRLIAASIVEDEDEDQPFDEYDPEDQEIYLAQADRVIKALEKIGFISWVNDHLTSTAFF